MAPATSLRHRPWPTPARALAPTTPRPTRPANVHAITVADTSVALAWDPAHDSDGSVTRYAVYRNGVLLGQPHSTGFLASHLAPATPYSFTVIAIDGGAHRSAAGGVDITTQAPLPATGPAYAYMLATTGASFDDLQRHYMQIAAVSPTYFHLGPDLAILGQDDPLVTGWARLRGIDVEPRVESQDPAILHTLLTSDANRSDLIARISALVAENGYDGINIDFEAGAAADRPLLTAFASQLAQTLHAQGAKLTMAVAAKTSATLTGRAGFYDYPALAAIADRLFVMAWDLHWATSPAGPDLGRHLGGEDHQVHHDRPERPALHDRHAAVRLRLARWGRRRHRTSGTT